MVKENPEYNWNDYSGLDVKGKTVVVLINDPGLYTGDSTAGILKGTTKADECIIYTAHWDHFGVGEKDGNQDRSLER